MGVFEGGQSTEKSRGDRIGKAAEVLKAGMKGGTLLAGEDIQ